MTRQLSKNNEKIYQLDTLISAVYNVVYVKTGKYPTNFIDTTDLKMIRFKLTDYDLDTIFDKTKIKYIGKFPTGVVQNGNEIEEIWFKRQGETHMSIIRIVPYPNEKDINKIKNPINVNQVIRTLLSELVVNDRTNNIILPIINVDVKGSDLIDYDKVKNYINKNEFYSIQITERYYSLTTLDLFLKEYPVNANILKSIIYQAVDVLNQIGISYPKFRCNQLFPEMICCYLKQHDKTIFPELKLNNFYLSEISEIIKNNYLDGLNIPNIESQYSDLYQLLNHLWNNNQADINKYPDIVSLFNVILPEKIRSSEKYLSEQLWNKLTDEEKTELRVKSIRGHSFFKDINQLFSTKFVEIDKDNDLFGGDSEDQKGSKLEANESEKKELEDKSIPIIKSTKKEELIENDNPLITEDEDDDDDIELDDLELDEEIDFESDKEEIITNKKNSNNDIDVMSNKNSNKRRNTTRNRNDSDYGTTEERTEETPVSIPSRIINVSESNVVSKPSQQRNKLKRYRGSRIIRLTTINDISDLKNQPNYDYNPGQLNNPNINTIGSFLGATPNDLNQRPTPFKTMARTGQYDLNDPGQSLPGQFPPNISNQIPGPIQYPQAQDNSDFLSRYNAAMASSGQMQTQMDPNMLSAMMQQQQQNIQMPQQQQTMYGQQIPNLGVNQMPIPQMGGSKQNPFFFQR